MEAATLPESFSSHSRKSPVTEPWEPLYSRTTDNAVILGFRADRPHLNGRGLVHGGLISALADNAMGLSCGRFLDEGVSVITVNLTLDFVGSARAGQWLEFDTNFVRAGSTLCFAQAMVTADGEPCARANAVFRVVKKPH